MKDTAQEMDIEENLITFDPHKRRNNKDMIYGETEVAEFMGPNTLNVKSQGSVETQIAAFPPVDQVFSIY